MEMAAVVYMIFFARRNEENKKKISRFEKVELEVVAFVFVIGDDVFLAFCVNIINIVFFLLVHVFPK